MALKEASFTFTVPKTTGVSPETSQASTSFTSQSPEFSALSRSPMSSHSSPLSKTQNPLEWSSLTSFDPAMLNLLDDSPQPTATEGARQLDFGFGTSTDFPSNMPYTTIASNPMFMSYASAFDSASPMMVNPDPNPSFFDLNALTWSPPPHQDSSSLDDLLNNYMPRGPDYPFMTAPLISSESPVTHHSIMNQSLNSAASHSPSSTSSPSSNASDPLFDLSRDSSSSDSDRGLENIALCPKTKVELLKRIQSSGLSPFAPANNVVNVRKSETVFGPMISCAGTSLPKTQKSDQNIEVLSAWRSITSNPKFKVRPLSGRK